MWIGLDIGGANLKASDGESRTVSRPFPIWRSPERLADELWLLLTPWPTRTGLAVTMTAELADCFATKHEGVARILDAVESVADGSPVQVWQTGGEFIGPDDARDLVPLVAAANWHALATWAGRLTPDGRALLVDFGSTTLDIIPLEHGLPNTQGLTDLERLQSGELVYIGLRRTPLCALRSEVDLRGQSCGVAAELFATTLDSGLLTDAIPEAADDTNTADGRPATRDAAHARIAHLVGCDGTELSRAETQSLAQQFQQTLAERVTQAVERIASHHSPNTQLILSGEGSAWLTTLLFRSPRLAPLPSLDLSHSLGPQHAQGACAYALARLASERSV
jgi:probable H4MPT-linked C1 transfer pathway protein